MTLCHKVYLRFKYLHGKVCVHTPLRDSHSLPDYLALQSRPCLHLMVRLGVEACRSADDIPTVAVSRPSAAGQPAVSDLTAVQPGHGLCHHPCLGRKVHPRNGFTVRQGCSWDSQAPRAREEGCAPSRRVSLRWSQRGRSSSEAPSAGGVQSVSAPCVRAGAWEGLQRRLDCGSGQEF